MTDQPGPGDLASVWAGPFELPPLGDLSDLEARQGEWRRSFADGLFGPVPGPPDSLTVTRSPLRENGVERLEIAIAGAGRSFTVDAALWLPRRRGAPAPLICGLDFLGPAGVLASDEFPLDPAARVYSRPEYGAKNGELSEVLRGTSAYRWPVELLLDRGYAVLTSCYGSWTPDDPDAWRGTGTATVTVSPEAGAISLWAWAISRLVDVASALPEVDHTCVAVAGHSRLGKAALWAAACDGRIGAVLANAAGCCGSAPARHHVGETVAELAERFPHWLGAGRPAGELSVDQHQLIACIAPRAVYIAGAEADLWADPLGSYAALRAAAPAWGEQAEEWPEPPNYWERTHDITEGRRGHHIRPGGHDLLPYDWRRFLDFLASASNRA